MPWTLQATLVSLSRWGWAVPGVFLLAFIPVTILHNNNSQPPLLAHSLPPASSPPPWG